LSKMKVLYVDSSASGYGGEICLLEMVTRLSTRGFEPLVVLPEKGVLTEKLREKGIPFRVMPLAVIDRRIFKPAGFAKFCRNFIPSVVVLRRIIKKEGVALVHSNTSIVLNGAIAAKLGRVPHVWHIREIFESRFGFFGFFLKRFNAVFSDRVICISRAVQKSFGKRASRTELIYDGIDLAVWNPEGKAGQPLEKFGVAPGESAVVMVGRINRWKGQDVFIRSAGLVAAKFPRVKFLIVGDYRREYAGVAAELFRMAADCRLKGKVIFTGYLDRAEVRDVMAAADIVVHASKQAEPFGTVVTEAMALEKPVVATATGGPAETVEDGVTGILVPPGDFMAMAEAVMSLLQNPESRKRMGEAARQRVARFFNIKDTIDRTEKIYRQATGLKSEKRA
jgi:glycosyltransferase involved in cell wall biosynthesis